MAFNDTAVRPHQAPSARHKLTARRHLPLTLLLAGFPLWWILGLSAILPILIAVPLLIQLASRRQLRVPRGFGWWLLFLIWVCASAALLWVNAPGAVPGGDPARLLVFAYRLGWYGSCTVALLWVINTKKEDLSDSRVVRLLGWMFVVVVAGGLVGVLAPRFEITSVAEMLLPGSLRSNGFVQSIVHPAAANLSTFMGYEVYRPIAPFAFANSWGSNLSMFLPFFLLGWLPRRAGWRRYAAPLVLAAAVPPVVYSMNRGLWATLALALVLCALYLVLRGQRRSRVRAVIALLLLLGIGTAIFAASPLADTAIQRLDTAHSNDRRTQLLSQTVASTLEGSPVAGFGSTRDVQGSFGSIAGGSTADCPACGVPPLGTQGHLWLVIFSQGLVGTFFFLMFFFVQFRQFWRARTRLQLAAAMVLVFFAVQMLIYDTLGMPLFTIMLALGLAWRERYSQHGVRIQVLRYDWLTAAGARRLVSAGLVAGLLVGGTVAFTRPASFSAQTTILLAPTPVYLSGTSGSGATESVTVDTEAALVLTQSTLDAVRAVYPQLSNEQIRARTQITATPNTRVMHLKFTDTDRQRAGRVTEQVAEQYLQVRGQFLQQRRDQVLNDLLARLPESADVQNVTETVPEQAVSGDAVSGDAVAQLRNQVIDLSVASTSAGTVLNSVQVAPARNQPEVAVVSWTLLGLLAGLGGAALASRRRATPALQANGFRRE